MAYTYEQLSRMTVVDLRKIADGIDNEAVKGHLVMHKEQLLPALCKALGIEAHAHHEARGINKSALKAEIRKLKSERLTTVQKKDYKHLREIRRQIHDLKRKIRKSLK
jgi:protein-arginine kinase activator protein McsA